MLQVLKHVQQSWSWSWLCSRPSTLLLSRLVQETHPMVLSVLHSFAAVAMMHSEALQGACPMVAHLDVPYVLLYRAWQAIALSAVAYYIIPGTNSKLPYV